MFDNDLTLAEIMGVYNAARAAARRGKEYKGRVLEMGRLNRALGLLLTRPEKKSEFDVNVKSGSCSCPDAGRRHYIETDAGRVFVRLVCKHLAEELIVSKINHKRRRS